MAFERKEQKADEIIERICDEAKSRPIIPFFGAGISISAGFPTTKYLTHYLAKVDFAISVGVFEDSFPTLKDGKSLDYYRKHPSQYIENFGWPEFNQINAILWDWLHKVETGTEGGKHENKGKVKLKAFFSKTEGREEDDRYEEDNCYEEIFGENKPLEQRDHIRAIVQWTLRKELAERESGTKQAILKEWKLWKKIYHDEENKEKEPELLYGDWEILLDKLCEGNFDLADTLFTSLGSGLYPTLSHRYLTFLQPKLDIPLFLTTNFDSLLEYAFQQEGRQIKVFDIHKDAELPHPSLVQRKVSLLKLHGSAYGLRFGERLKYQLADDERSNALSYITT